MCKAISTETPVCFRNKRQTEKRKKGVAVSNANNKTRGAIAFRLSEFSPQYEILPACKGVDGPLVLTPTVSNIKTEGKCNFKISTFTKRKYQNMMTVKPTASCCKSGTKVVSLPSIPLAGKQDKSSLKNPSKTHTTAKR